MADKISGYGRAGLDVGTTRARAVGRASPDSSAEATGRTRAADDSVDFTNTAVRLKAIETRLADVPDVDQARVAALRERIESGNYRPDAERIAQKLMSMERELA
jgi:negative regulator of flagellin synthesis FlgM